MICAVLMSTSQRPQTALSHKVGFVGPGDLIQWKSMGPPNNRAYVGGFYRI